MRKKDEQSYRESSSNVLIARGRTSNWKKSECGKSQLKPKGRTDDWRKLEKMSVHRRKLEKMSVHIVERKAIGRKIVQS